jgi:hypothetical protein
MKLSPTLRASLETTAKKEQMRFDNGELGLLCRRIADDWEEYYRRYDMKAPVACGW